MSIFNIGDRVKYAADGDFVFLRGKTGTVKGFCAPTILVEFDENIHGHDGLGNCGAKTKDGHGYYVSELNLFTLPKYKVGDRVKVQGVPAKEEWRARYNGTVTTIKCINPNGEKAYGKHHYSVSEKSCVFIFYESELVPVDNEQKIVITTDGKTTVAKLYDGDKVVKEAKADCSPEDKFDFTQGAKLAFERLTHVYKFEVGKQYQYNDLIIEITDAEKRIGGNHYRFKIIKGDFYSLEFDEGSVFGMTLKPYEPPQVYNGKVVCIKTEYPHFWTVGKVYHVVNGIIHNNIGSSRTGITAENLRHIGSDKNEFIPLVE